ncbi:MAG: DUF6448 family protein [Candidatus Krumholzibacteriia bacterium]
MRGILSGTLPLAAVVALLAAPTIALAHCDTLDGPVVADARAALADGSVTPVLKWVEPDQEEEVRQAFQKTVAVRDGGAEAKELADRWFFETIVRLHRESEGAPYTGLKPGGTAARPVESADRALERESVDEIVERAQSEVSEGIRSRFDAALEAHRHRDESVMAGRRYVREYVTWVHYLEGLHGAIHDAGAHGSGGHDGGGHEGGDPDRGGHEGDGHEGDGHGTSGHDVPGHDAGGTSARSHDAREQSARGDDERGHDARGHGSPEHEADADRATDELEQEHRATRLVLREAADEAVHLQSGGQVRADRILKMVDFFASFTDRCHHAKEERYLFPALVAAGGERVAGLVAELEREHQEGRRLIATVREAVQPAAAGDRVDAQTLAGHLQAYVALMETHIAVEHDDVFPRVSELLTDDARRTLVRGYHHIEHDELGEGFHERYHRLAQELSAE